jgi:hypothetical protein
MGHHRGLVITMIVIVVVFIVGTSTMAWATNDTDAPIQDDLAVAGSRSLASPTVGNYDSNFVVVLHVSYFRGPRTVKIVPTQHYNCTDDEYAVDVPITKGGDQPPVYVHLTIKSTGACAQEPSYAWYKISDPGLGPDSLDVSYGNFNGYAGNPLWARCETARNATQRCESFRSNRMDVYL